MRSIVVQVLCVSLTLAGTATQTDWVSGGGVQGPVSDWEDYFWSSDENIDYSAGLLRLLPVPIPPIEHTVDGDFSGASSICSADIDGDGDTDILGAGAYCDDITWWENTNGTGAVWTEHTIDGNYSGAISVYSADLDDDGDADVIGAGFTCDHITWWENIAGTGAVWAEHTICENYAGAMSVYSTDVDGDGDTDVLGAGHDCDDITWWENQGGAGTTWIEHTVDGDFWQPFSVFSADVDGDGDSDILGAGSACDDVTWWENADGNGISWVEHTIDEYYDYPRSVYSIDVDGDGDADVLAAGGGSDEITWWENTDGAGISWVEHTIDDNYSGPVSVYSTDLDGDGDADVLGAGFTCDDITWWENTDGIGTAWSEHTVDGDFDGARFVYATDVDSDGDEDIVGAGHYCAEITWWDSFDYFPSGALESSILDAGDVEEWNIFLASTQQPAGTSVSFQFRSSDNSSNMGVWSDTVFSPDTPLGNILADSTRYLQYKVIMETNEPGVSPELAEVAFGYTLLVGVEESSSSDIPSWSLQALENPSLGFLSVLISVPETRLVELSIHDISGRVIAEISQEFPSGTYCVNFTSFVEGVYFCTMVAGDFAITKKYIVLK